MTEIGFYHLTRASAQAALPVLLSKTLARGKRALVKLVDADAVATWNEHLWAYEPGSFLPHGSIDDPDPEEQPIFLTHLDENPGRAEYLFLVEGADRTDLESFDRVVILFDGKDPSRLDAARRKWKLLREASATLSYWQQDPTGRWNQKKV